MGTKLAPTCAIFFVIIVIILKPTLWKMPHFNPTLAYDMSMIFLSGLKVWISQKFSLIVNNIHLPLNSQVHTHLLM